MRVGLGYDIHPLLPGRKMIIGGVVIPVEKGPKGHSDGDVLYHALADALLGGAALGDIGSHFSDADPKWKGAPSFLFVKSVCEKLRMKKLEVVNIDANLHLESPKLQPYLPQMVKNICLLLGLGTKQVSLKAKSGEGMDAVGRGEAIAAQVVVLLTERGAARK